MINTEGDFSETPSPVVSAPHPTQNIRDIDLYKVRYIYLSQRLIEDGTHFELIYNILSFIIYNNNFLFCVYELIVLSLHFKAKTNLNFSLCNKIKTR